MIRRSNAGFTLVEVTVSAFILVAVLGICFAAMLSGQTSWAYVDANTVVHEELRKAVSELSDDLSAARPATVLGVPPDGVWYKSIAFRKPKGIFNGDVVMSDTPIRYVLGGFRGKQLLRFEGNTQRVVANEIIAFRVRRNPAKPDMVIMVLRAEKNTIKDDPMKRKMRTAVKMRN